MAAPDERPDHDALSAKEWQQIDSIFNEIVELERSERQRRLLELTENNAKLRSEVASLLTHDDSGTQLPALRPEDELATTPTRPAGSNIGRYRLLFPVAINRSSEVWCAEDTTETEKDLRVAMKFLRDEANSVRRFERFRNEATLLAQFRHPNVAEFLECGRDSTGIPFIVMRYVSGTPITEFADEKILDIDDRIQLMIRVCDAVSYAHRFLVVHRDLKPANIFVTSQHEPVILDFGISKTIDDRESPSDSNDLSLTTTGERPMTPAYASPEQVHGDTISTATDLHALGLILYELLTGHHAFSDAAHPHETKLLDRVCRSLPCKPSDIVSATAHGLSANDDVPRAPRMLAAQRNCSQNQLHRKLRGALDSVTLRALAKDPTDRYASVADFRNDLQNVLDRRPVSAKLKNDRLRNVIRHHPLKSLTAAMVATGIAIVSIASGLVYKSQQQWSQRSERYAVQTQSLEARQSELTTALNSAKRRFENTQTAVLAATQTGLDELDISFGELASSEAAAFVARRLAEEGQYAKASRLLRKIPLQSEQVRIDVAAAYQALGQPGNGIIVLSDTPGILNSQPAATLYLRLLLDAGRWRQAELHVEESTDVSFLETAAGALVLAEYRRGIGWEEGAKQLLDGLLAKWGSLAMTADQGLQLAWLQGEASALSDTTSLRPVPLLLRGKSLRKQAKDLAERDELDDAVAKYREVIDTFESVQPNHFVAFKAMQDLSELADERRDKAESKRWNEHVWNRIRQADEWGTATAAWCAIFRLRSASDDERQQILSRYENYPKLRLDPYLQRQFLTYDFEWAFQKEDWTYADTAIGKLKDIEKELWGDKSIEYAYVLAAQKWASGKLGRADVDKISTELKAILAGLLKELPPCRALAFLSPVVHVTERSIPEHEWIHFYLMHRYNADDAQRKMLRHVLQQLPDDCTDTVAILRAAIE